MKLKVIIGEKVREQMREFMEDYHKRNPEPIEEIYRYLLTLSKKK